jgi:GTP-binding protein
MEITESKFIKSSPDVANCPAPNIPEYAFIGRSNVGKSSLINMLTGRKNLAKISGTPGKTQLINHFLINETWYLVDLPGYGFAKTSKKNRKIWESMIDGYLNNRPNLVNTFILIDARHEPLKSDLSFITSFGIKNQPFSLVFTKSDKLSKTRLNHNLNTYHDILSEQWEEMPLSIVSSAKTGLGRDQILGLIGEMNGEFSTAK